MQGSPEGFERRRSAQFQVGGHLDAGVLFGLFVRGPLHWLVDSLLLFVIFLVMEHGEWLGWAGLELSLA